MNRTLTTGFVVFAAILTIQSSATAAVSPEEAARLKSEAQRMVRLWEEKQLCSPIYIERWQTILDAKPAAIAQSMLAMDDDPWGPALRQNTPFAVVITP